MKITIFASKIDEGLIYLINSLIKALSIGHDIINEDKHLRADRCTRRENFNFTETYKLATREPGDHAHNLLDIHSN